MPVVETTGDAVLGTSECMAPEKGLQPDERRCDDGRDEKCSIFGRRPTVVRIGGAMADGRWWANGRSRRQPR